MAIINGTNGSDTLAGTADADQIFGRDGNDTISGGAGDDLIDGGAGDDLLTGDAGNDTFDFSTRRFGNDTITDFTSGDLIDLSVLNVADFASLQPFIAQSGSNTIITLFYQGTTESLTLLNVLPSSLSAANFLLATGTATLNVTGTNFNDALFGGNGGDTLAGLDGNDTLSAGAGNDTLDGGNGNDRLSGGEGSDVFVFSARRFGDDIVTDLAAEDRIDLSAFGIGDLATLQPFISQSGANTVLNFFYFSNGESITLNNVQATSLTSENFIFNTSIAALNVTGTANSDVLFGGNGNDTLNGGDGNDTLATGAGNDTLIGGAGNDRLIGGAGDDVFQYAVRRFGDDTITDFVAGDKIDLSALNVADLASLQPFISQSGANTVISLFYSSSSETITIANLASNSLTADSFIFNTSTAALTVTGTLASDVLFGGAGNDRVQGQDGDDTLSGGSGDDIIDGGTGSDRLLGGVGNDTFVFSARRFGGDTIGDFAPGDQIDLSAINVPDLATLQPFLTQVGANSVITLGYGASNESITILNVAVASLTAASFIFNTSGAAQVVNGTTGNDVLFGGNGNDQLLGFEGNDQLAGGGGNDVLDGGSGNDRLFGGAGDDRLTGGSGNDIFQYTSNGFGNDLITDFSTTDRIDVSALNIGDLATLLPFITQASGNTQLFLGFGPSTESITLENFQSSNLNASSFVFNSSTASLTVNGTDNPDVLIGGLGADMLFGGAGDDLLIGGAGADRLDGGAGIDRLYGGQGDDTYFVDDQADLIFENGNEGRDAVISTAGFYLYSNVEDLTLATGAGDIFGVGNELANTITGNEGSNLLIAGNGDDIVRGGDGVDALFGEDGNDQLFGDAGIDYLVGGNGNDILNGGDGPDAIYGENGNDTLIGGADFQTDILVGGAGNDILRGDSGFGDYDLLYGNTGDDTFYVDTPADLVFEQPGEGADTVIANIVGAGYYLYDNIENLVLMGETPFGVGNALDNVLTGNDIGNYLLGGDGNDTLNGRGGGDVLFGEAGNDTFVFERGTGGDVIGDFAPGADRIDVHAFGFASYAALQAVMGENNGTSFINLGNGDLVVINGVALASLHAADFVL